MSVEIDTGLVEIGRFPQEVEELLAWLDIAEERCSESEACFVESVSKLEEPTQETIHRLIIEWLDEDDETSRENKLQSIFQEVPLPISVELSWLDYAKTVEEVLRIEQELDPQLQQILIPTQRLAEDIVELLNYPMLQRFVAEQPEIVDAATYAIGLNNLLRSGYQPGFRRAVQLGNKLISEALPVLDEAGVLRRDSDDASLVPYQIIYLKDIRKSLLGLRNMWELHKMYKRSSFEEDEVTLIRKTLAYVEILFDKRFQPDIAELAINGLTASNAQLREDAAGSLAKCMMLLSDFGLDCDPDSVFYSDFVKRALSIDGESAAEKIRVFESIPEENQEQTEENKGAEKDKDESIPFRVPKSIGDLAHHIPAFVLDYIRRIEFTPIDKTTEDKLRVVGTEFHSPSLNGGYIVICSKYLRDGYSVTIDEASEHALTPEEISEAVDNAAFDTFVAAFPTLMHEVGHAFHERLPYAALLEWELARSQGVTGVTSYSISRHRKNHPHRFFEDFAETFSMLITDPGALHAISKVRFEAMSKLVNEFLPNGLNDFQEKMR